MSLSRPRRRRGTHVSWTNILRSEHRMNVLRSTSPETFTTKCHWIRFVPSTSLAQFACNHSSLRATLIGARSPENHSSCSTSTTHLPRHGPVPQKIELIEDSFRDIVSVYSSISTGSETASRHPCPPNWRLLDRISSAALEMV